MKSDRLSLTLIIVIFILLCTDKGLNVRALTYNYRCLRISVAQSRNIKTGLFSRISVSIKDEDDSDNDPEYVADSDLIMHWKSLGRNMENFIVQEALLSYIDAQDSLDLKRQSSDVLKRSVSSMNKSLKESLEINPGLAVENVTDISVGIDLGTSNSAISFISNGKPVIIPIDGSSTVPSAVSFLPDGQILVGESALARRVIDPLNTFLSIKRVIGRSVEETKGIGYKIQRNTSDSSAWKLKPATRAPVSPEDVSSEVLKYLLVNAQRSLGVIAPIKRAVITVPAYFNPAQCAATIRAGISAGLDKVKLLREPEAAAFAYGLTQREKQIVLVFDLGGGTFDVSVLDVGDGFAEVIATSGDSRLGGDDFDMAIMNWMIEEYSKVSRKAMNPREDLQFLSRARKVAEDTKLALTNAKEHKIMLQGPQGDPDLILTLTREKFESLTAKLLARLLIPLREVALMSGVNLIGESLNTDKSAADLLELYSTTHSLNSESSVASMKKQQQVGRENAKKQRKVRASLGKELNRIKSETGDNSIAVFPGGFQLNDVILVGGATRMPAVQRLIQSLTGIKPRITVNPDEAVSLGAAVFAGTLDGSLNSMQVMSTWQAALVRAFYESYGNKNSIVVEGSKNAESSKEANFNSGEPSEVGCLSVAVNMSTSRNITSKRRSIVGKYKRRKL